MPRTTPVSDIMTRDVKTVGCDEQLSEVRRVLTAGGFHHLPVVEGDDLVGILSSRDLIRVYQAATAKPEAGADELLDETATIRDTMQTEILTMRPDDTIERAIDLLGPGDVHSVVVLDRQDRLVGIVTNLDVLNWLFD
jgi:CBS domain-containing membrane protein